MAEVRKNTVHPLHIEGYTAEGMGVARLDGRVVFIPGTIRGEDWEVQLLKVNKGVAWGKGTRLISPSPVRQEPDCPYSGRCGGCQYRHMSYEEELAAKGQRVRDALERVGGVHLELPPVLGAESPLRYRNKVQFPVSRGKCGLSIGFYRPRSHDVVDTEDCLLQPEADTALRLAFKGWMEDFQIPAYDESTGTGADPPPVCPHQPGGGGPVLRGGQREGAAPRRRAGPVPCGGAVPKLAGLVLNVNLRDTNVILGDAYRTLWGRDWLEEELCGLTFRLSVPSFFQINRDQTERLYAAGAGIRRAHRGGDGAGPVLRHRHHLPVPWPAGPGRSSGRRWSPRPSRTPGPTPLRNGVTNAGILLRGRGGGGGPAGRPRACVPRSSAWTRPGRGCAPEVPAILAAMAPERIVYVSCDPATLARDVKRLGGAGLPGRPGPAGGSVSQDRPCGDGAADGTLKRYRGGCSMLEAITYQAMLEDISRNNILEDTIGILITRPELEVGKDILSSLNYYHHASGKNVNFYLPGYGAYWHGTYPDGRVVTKINGVDWSFSDSMFVQFVGELQAHSSWRYSGESELLMLEYKNGVLRFEKVMRFYLENMLRDNLIHSTSSFFQQLLTACGQDKSPGGLSDRLAQAGAIQVTKNALMDRLPNEIKGLLLRGKYLCVQDFSPKNTQVSSSEGR